MKVTATVRMGRIPTTLADPRMSEEVYRTAARHAIGAGAPYLQRKLAKATPVGVSGLARKSVTSHVTLAGWPTGFVGYAEPAAGYIGFVDTGTRPHWPPLAPLVLWAARKFALPARSPEARRLGYLVARKISRRGTKAQRFIELTVTQDGPAAQKLMASAAMKVLRSMKA